MTTLLDDAMAHHVWATDRLLDANAADGEAWMALLRDGVDPDADLVEVEEPWRFHAPAGLPPAQAIQHGTDHRSHICTALTNLGIEPPEIDP